MAADQCGQERNRELISFREWAEVLARDTEVPDSRREEYRGAIIAFLGFCKRRHAGVSVILIQSYLSGLAEQERSGAREALRWWYRAAQGSGSACGLPSRVPCRVPTGTRPRFTVGTRQDGSPFSRRAPRALLRYAVRHVPVGTRLGSKPSRASLRRRERSAFIGGSAPLSPVGSCRRFRPPSSFLRYLLSSALRPPLSVVFRFQSPLSGLRFPLTRGTGGCGRTGGRTPLRSRSRPA